MKRMLALIALLLLVFDVCVPLAAVAFAADVTVTWTNPTTRTDNTPLPASEIGKTRIDYGLCDPGGVFPTNLGTVQFKDVAGAATSTSITVTPNGLWCFRASTFDIYGFNSAFSNVATKATVAPPKPPVLSTVSQTAYMPVVQENRFVMVPVGTIPVGTQCDTTQNVNGYYVVPRSAVQWIGSVKPLAVVAQCG